VKPEKKKGIGGKKTFEESHQKQQGRKDRRGRRRGRKTLLGRKMREEGVGSPSGKKKKN